MTKEEVGDTVQEVRQCENGVGDDVGMVNLEFGRQNKLLFISFVLVRLKRAMIHLADDETRVFYCVHSAITFGLRIEHRQTR